MKKCFNFVICCDKTKIGGKLMSNQYNGEKTLIYRVLRGFYSDEQIDKIIDVYDESGNNQYALWLAIDKDVYQNRDFDQHLALMNALKDCNYNEGACLIGLDSRIARYRTVEEQIKLMHACAEHEGKSGIYNIATDVNFLKNKTTDDQIEYMNLLEKYNYNKGAREVLLDSKNINKSTEELESLIKNSVEDDYDYIMEKLKKDVNEALNSGAKETKDTSNKEEEHNTKNEESVNEEEANSVSEEYQVLGVSEDASYEEIQQAFKTKTEQLLSEDNVDAEQLKKLQNSFITITYQLGKEITSKDIADEIYKMMQAKNIRRKNNDDKVITPPRNRRYDESTSDYEKYLEEYYQKHFSIGLKENKNEKILGTNIYKPRDRRPYETDEEYEQFLEKYYKDKDFSKIPTGTKHKIKKRRKNRKHRLLKKLLTIATVAAIGLGIWFSTKFGLHKDPKPTQTVEQPVDSPDFTQSVDNDNEEFEKQLGKEVDEILKNYDNKDITKLTIGDTIKLKEGTKYYFNSQKASPTGTIGNKYTSPKSNYLINSVALVDKKTKQIIGVSYDRSLSVKEMMEMYGVEKDDCRVVGLIGNNGKLNPNDALGWVVLAKDNFTKTGTINNHKGKVR